MIFSVASSQASTIIGQSIKVGTNPELKTDASNSITILSRHDAALFNLVASEFAKSDLGHSVGVTSSTQIKQQTPATTEQFINFINSDKVDVSMAWGGGPTIFNNLADRGYLQPITDQALSDYIEANISDSIAGAQLKHYNDADQLLWAASAISSFGFTVNNAELQSRNLPKPTTWEDLASPDFFTTATQYNIGMGNAPDTTSNTRIYQIILQKYGWDKGWEIINSMAGNSKIFGGSVETRASVITGDTAVAMTIDFYGLIAQQDNPNCEYIIPTNGSIVNGDPIAITKNPGNATIAKAFMEFVLSKYGQSLLMDESINRLPVRADAFDTEIGRRRTDIKEVYDKTIANQGINFDENLATAWIESLRFHFQATITDVHQKLRESWRQMITSYEQGGIPYERFLQIREIYGAPVITADEAKSMNDQIISDPTFRSSKTAEWQQSALTKFNSAVNAIDDEYTLSGTTSKGSAGQDTNVRDVSFNPSLIALFLAFGMMVNIIRKKKYQF